MHQAHGLTVDELVISSEDLFSGEVEYTALSLVCTEITPNVSDLTKTLAIDITYHKAITATINEIGDINRTSGSVTCQDDLVNAYTKR
ncbi:unnamed protein product [Rotaria magnacalcarata]|uniref:Uncharacterized protein n=2 Tax=Rotaria magnacalcarata TaxID=392030 RepID=A0A816FU48_9BILA|nr:unnamed protein product [Rotaria magnacalcarata]